MKQEARSAAGATGKQTIERPTKGGSYIRNKDGSLTRQEWTRQPGERPAATAADKPLAAKPETGKAGTGKES